MPNTVAPNVKPPRPPIPWWGWVFGGLCLLIPIISLGGAIQGALGGGGAFACIAVSRGPKPATVPARVGLCAAIVGLCWALFFLLVIVAAVMMAKPA